MQHFLNVLLFFWRVDLKERKTHKLAFTSQQPTATNQRAIWDPKQTHTCALALDVLLFLTVRLKESACTVHCFGDTWPITGRISASPKNTSTCPFIDSYLPSCPHLCMCSLLQSEQSSHPAKQSISHLLGQSPGLDPFSSSSREIFFHLSHKAQFPHKIWVRNQWHRNFRHRHRSMVAHPEMIMWPWEWYQLFCHQCATEAAWSSSRSRGILPHRHTRLLGSSIWSNSFFHTQNIEHVTPPRFFVSLLLSTLRWMYKHFKAGENEYRK